MPATESENENTRSGGFLPPGDQFVVAVLAFLGFVCLLTWWIHRGGQRGDLIETDRVGAKRAEWNQGEYGHVSFSVDINQADWPQFAQLPGIGEERARRIVAERDRHGDFVSKMEIARRVKGIGPKTMNQIVRYLRLSKPDGEEVEDERSLER